MLRKTVEGYPYEEFKYCECGCGFTLPKFDKWWGRERFFINYHGWNGKKHSEESKRKMGETKIGKRMGENNPEWKYDDVGYGALHLWINKYLPPKKVCQKCFNVPPKDCACIGKLNRDFKNWLRVCRKCHKKIDGAKRDPKTGRYIKKN